MASVKGAICAICVGQSYLAIRPLHAATAEPRSFSSYGDNGPLVESKLKVPLAKITGEQRKPFPSHFSLRGNDLVGSQRHGFGAASRNRIEKLETSSARRR